jgi:putative phosphoribosyl transferase
LTRDNKAEATMTNAVTEESRIIPASGVALLADVGVPAQVIGLIVFVHGSGSGRRSPRNRRVATALQQAGFATVLIDLLSGEEAVRDELDYSLRFDIDLLSRRVEAVVDWLAATPSLADLPLGLYGASTGAAAALVATAHRPAAVAAVVSRGGRPDLAGGALPLVQAPTMLIVGGNDQLVLDLNREAMRRLAGVCEVRVVPGASHLFEEPGALDTVIGHAVAWFQRYLTPSPARRSFPLVQAASKEERSDGQPRGSG